MRRPSPNFDARPPGLVPDMIVLHYTDMADVEGALRWLADPASKVSAHYLITRAGTLVQMVEETERAWHAGVSAWQGVRDVNARSIGIELDSPGHTPEPPRFPGAQVEALIELLADLRRRWPVPLRNVVGHSDIAPRRKIDPGEAFPWRTLAEAGQALWVAPSTRPAPFSEAAFFAALTRCGYDAAPTDAAGRRALVDAFHRRHLPERVGEAADGVSLATAEALARLTEADAGMEDYRRFSSVSRVLDG